VLLLNNSTFSGNSAGSGGGGLDNYQAAATLNNCTLSGNSAGGGGGGIANFGTLALTNTIVASNTAPVSPDINLDISGSFSGANNLTNVNPLLAPLGSYGGPTPTMPPLLGSPAIDAGSDAVTNLLVTDQRGFPRLSGAHVDIGAVEAQAVSAASAPLLKGVAIQSGAFSFNFTNLSVADFTVLASTNVGLPSSQWSTLGAAAQLAPGQYHFTDSTAPNYPRRFYRVVSP